FHTLDISGRCAVTLVHVAAADPFRAGSHSNLITHAVVTYYSAHGVATMATVIARERRIVMAWVANAVMDGVVPVVIVIFVLSVPATVVRFECIMRPANTSVGAPHNNVLSSKSQCPDLRCVGVIDAWLNHRRKLKLRPWLNSWSRFRKIIVE